MELAGAPTPRRRKVGSDPVAEKNPVARVQLDVSLPHLDRPFDYLVPASMADDAVPGARVSVRFAGAEHSGFILARAESSDHEGTLSRLRKVVSREPVLSPDIADLARSVANRYAGTVADVLRLAVPPRHARAERRESPTAAPVPPCPDPGQWSDYEQGDSLVAALALGQSPRVVMTAAPDADWADMLARLVLTTLAAGRGAVVVLPDARDVARLDAALRVMAGRDHHVVLGADLGPEARYRRWLDVRRGAVNAVIGARSAGYAPVSDLGLVCIWDDGDDLHAEPRAPYAHLREVLLLRAHLTGAAAVVAGYARTAEAQQLITSGWAQAVTRPRADVRTAAPVVRVSGDDWEQARDAAARTARLPSAAWKAARDGLSRGPVLVQVPRAGYVPGVACRRCRTPARCTECGGPLALGAVSAPPSCRLCGTTADRWACGQCGEHDLRATTIGVGRTAEELGRAFPGTPVVVSRGDDVHDTVGAAPALVLATPGAEPVAEGGYASGLLLDGDVLLSRVDLRAAEEALRRWLRAAVLVRSAADGGDVVVVAESNAAAVQALVRWDPAGFASRELDERANLHFPPAARVAVCSGAAADVAELLSLVTLPAGAEVLGPMRVDESGDDDTVRAIIRVPRASGTALAAGLREAAGVRSVRKSGGAVRVKVDPVDLH